jgi:molecular chaperone DnaJ
MSQRDYYEVLGINKESDPKEIKKAYRKLAKEYHPDHNKSEDAETKFKEVQEAYEILSDDSKKRAYDQYGHAGAQGFGGQYGGGQAGAQGFGGGAPFDMGDLGDIFGSFFGGGGGMGGFGGGRSSNEGESLRYAIRLDFMEAMEGGEYKVNVDRDVACKDCDGTGSEDKELVTCDVCKGQGRVRKVQNTILGGIQVVAECDNCHGVGKEAKNKCKTCSGRGVQEETKAIKINIPAGAYDGMVLRYRGSGSAGANGGETGDLFIEISVDPHEEFSRRGNDIHAKEDISVSLAVLGGTIEVPTILGKVKLKIPNGTQSETIFRIKDKGVPVIGREGKRGDHYVRIIVNIPKKVSKEDKKLWEKLSKEK